MAKGSTSTQTPPPSVQAGTVAPGEVAGFPQGTITKAQEQQKWNDIGGTIAKTGSAAGSAFGGAKYGASQAGGIQMLPGTLLNPELYTLQKRQIQLPQGALSKLSSFNM